MLYAVLWRGFFSISPFFFFFSYFLFVFFSWSDYITMADVGRKTMRQPTEKKRKRKCWKFMLWTVVWRRDLFSQFLLIISLHTNITLRHTHTHSKCVNATTYTYISPYGFANKLRFHCINKISSSEALHGRKSISLIIHSETPSDSRRKTRSKRDEEHFSSRNSESSRYHSTGVV